MDNVARLSITIALDRADLRYLSGEVGTVTYRLANGTAQVLEIPDLDDPLAGEIYISNFSPRCTAADIDDDTLQKCRPHEAESPIKPTMAVRSRLLQPGETVSIVVRTTDPAAPGAGITKISGGGDFSPQEGTWELNHQLGGSAVITTVTPILEKVAWATLHALDEEEDEPKQVPTFVVLDGTQRILAISERHMPTANLPVEIDDSGKLTRHGIQIIAPFHRIATVSQPVVSLSATVDSQDRITIRVITSASTCDYVLDGDRKFTRRACMPN